MSTEPESLDDADVRRDFAQLGCEAYPEGSSRHAYRMTASSFYGVGRSHPDFREGETCYRCVECGDTFVVLDSEMAADEGCWDE